jgi:hypothetical protein
MIFAGFTLEGWKSNNSLPPDAILTDKQKDDLMQQMGLNHFLLKDPCEIRANLTEGIVIHNFSYILIHNFSYIDYL